MDPGVLNSAPKKTNKRSRFGCKSCKASKVKCDELKPSCSQCLNKQLSCDYTIELTWGGRPYKTPKVVGKSLGNTKVVNGVTVVANHPNQFKVREYKPRSKMVLKPVHAAKTISKKPDDAPLVGEVHNVPSSHQYDATRDSSNNGMALCVNAALTPSVETPNLEEVGFSTMNNGTERIHVPKIELLSDMAVMTKVTPIYDSFSQFSLPTEFEIPRYISPMPDVLRTSPELTQTFQFFLEHTSTLVVVAPNDYYKDNPFKHLLPRMALSCPSLLNILLAFGCAHQSAIQQASNFMFGGNEFASLKNQELIKKLMNKTLEQLNVMLLNPVERESDTTLATIMLLSLFGIFFSDSSGKWRKHLQGARDLILNRKDIGNNGLQLTLRRSNENDPKYFLARWFAYAEVIANLSSTNTSAPGSGPRLRYDYIPVPVDLTSFETEDDVYINLKDIDYLVGFDMKLMPHMAQANELVRAKASNTLTLSNELICEVTELTHEIISTLDATESKRDAIKEKYYKDDPNYTSYAMLRATNKIYALTTVLQVKRRILGMSRDSPVVKHLIDQISFLLENDVPPGSSAESCLTFTVFMVGCDLNDELMRRKYLNRLISLHVVQGVSGAHQARFIMEACWKTGQDWWVYLHEHNLDFTFAI